MQNDQFLKAKQNYVNLRANLAKNTLFKMDSCENGFELLFEHLEPEEQTALFSSLELLKDISAEKIKELMNSQLFVHQSLGISDEALNNLYQLGKKFLAEQAFENAGHIFILLAILCPQSLEVWLGLGKARKECKHYHDAALFYEKAIQLNPQSSLARAYADECKVFLRQ